MPQQKSDEKSWTIVYGDRTIPIRSYDLAEAMQTCISLIEKELAFNQVIRENETLKKRYVIDQMIAEKLKARFTDMAMAEEKRAIDMRIRGRKR